MNEMDAQTLNVSYLTFKRWLQKFAKLFNTFDSCSVKCYYQNMRKTYKKRRMMVFKKNISLNSFPISYSTKYIISKQDSC